VLIYSRKTAVIAFICCVLYAVGKRSNCQGGGNTEEQ